MGRESGYDPHISSLASVLVFAALRPWTISLPGPANIYCHTFLQRHARQGGIYSQIAWASMAAVLQSCKIREGFSANKFNEHEIFPRIDTRCISLHLLARSMKV